MKNAQSNKRPSLQQRDELLETLESRFERNLIRHEGFGWTDVKSKLEANAARLWSVGEMERTGGEPYVDRYDKKNGEITFYDCSPESPKVADACVTTAKQWIRERNIGRRITWLIWQQPRASNS